MNARQNRQNKKAQKQTAAHVNNWHGGKKTIYATPIETAKNCADSVANADLANAVQPAEMFTEVCGAVTDTNYWQQAKDFNYASHLDGLIAPQLQNKSKNAQIASYAYDTNIAPEMHNICRAAQAGNAQAQLALGLRLSACAQPVLLQDSVAQAQHTVDAENAVYWLQKSAEQGTAFAFAALDDMDARGHFKTSNRIDRAYLYARAATALRKAAENGDTAEKAEFGVCCEFGYGVQADANKALQLYAAAANAENGASTRGLLRAGDCYMRGCGVIINIQEAVKYYRRAAMQGSALAALKLARCMREHGIAAEGGITASALLNSAAENGLAEAQYELGLCYARGIGVKYDQLQATVWYEQAARQNNADAMCALAEISMEKAEYTKAFKLFEHAAELGNAVGQRRVGDCYFGGTGVGKDQKHAFVWYQKAAKRLDALALRDLGLCHLYSYGTTKNFKEAVTCFQQAAPSDPEAQRYLAECQLSQNNSEAIGNLQSAADRGSQEAAYKLAECYEKGILVKKDYKRASEIYGVLEQATQADVHVRAGIELLKENNANKAVQAFAHFKQAARPRNVEGSYQAGMCYQNGVGVASNITAAAECYKHAADKGHFNAAVKLAQIYALKQVNPETAEYAFRLYAKVANKNRQDIQLELAKCHENGVGTSKNPQKAKELYFELANDKHKAATVNLVAMFRSSILGEKYGKEAVVAYQLGANIGIAHAQYELGMSLEMQNQHENACKQFLLAAAQNLQIAIDHVKEISIKNVSDKVGITTAIQLCEVAGDNGLQAAQFKYAELVLAGKADEQQLKKTANYLLAIVTSITVAKQQAEKRSCMIERLKQMAENVTIRQLQFELAECYNHGFGTITNQIKAAEIYQQLAKNGNKEAAAELVALIQSGVLGSPHDEKTMLAYVECAKAQNANAYHELAQYCLENGTDNKIVKLVANIPTIKTKLLQPALNYAQGFAEPASDEAAFLEYTAKETYNNPDILCAIGRAYNFGWGVAKDVNNAIKYYFKAANYGSFDAIERLEKCISTSSNANLKTMLAEQWKLAKNNWVSAFFEGYCYYKGVGVRQNYELAIKQLLAGIQTGCSHSMVLLGQLYEYGHGIELNETKTIELYKQAADAKNKEGQYRLALKYRDDYSNSQNQQKYQSLLQLAANQGHSSAAYQLEQYYGNINSYYYQNSSAFEYINQAAIAGNVAAQSTLGYFYKESYSGSRNYQKATFWYQKAVDQGDTSAQSILENCRCQLQYQQSNNGYNANIQTTIQSGNVAMWCQLAYLLAQAAIDGKNTFGYESLGDCYFNGLSVSKSLQTAAINYEKAGVLTGQGCVNLADCYASGQIASKSEINVFSSLERANKALRAEINHFLTQMQ